MKLVCFCLLLAATATSAFRSARPFNRDDRQSELYDSATQKCCRGVAYPRKRTSYVFCCGNSTYDITEEMCCQGVPLPLSAGTRTACCGSMTYDVKASLCCMGRVAQLPEGTPVEDLEHFECREMKAVDTRNVSENELEPVPRSSKRIASYNGGFYRPVPPPPSNKCNGKTFNRTTHMCCNNTLKESSIPNAACCGDDQAYDNNKQLCCRSPEGNWQLSDKPPVSSNSPYYGMDPSCCGGVGYDMMTEVCCNQTVYKIPAGGQRWEYQCCGTGIIDTTTHTCCDRQNAKEKKTESEGCCGNETYSYRTQLCCYHKTNTKVFDKPDVRTQCCGGELINTRTHLCCYDYANTDGIFEKVLNKTTPRTQCCGNSTYDATKQLCCGSSAIPIESESKGLRCCGETDYNPDTHICCDQKVIEVTDPSKRSCCSIYSSDDYTYTRSCYGMNRPGTYPDYPQTYYAKARGEEETTETANVTETTDATDATEAVTAE